MEAAVYSETLVTNHQMNLKNHNLNLKHRNKKFKLHVDWNELGTNPVLFLNGYEPSDLKLGKSVLVPAMKGCSGSSGIAPLILNVSTEWRWLVKFTPWLFCLHETVPGTNLIWRWVGSRAGLVLKMRKISPDGSRTSDRPTHSIVTTSTAHSQLPLGFKFEAIFIKNNLPTLLGIFWAIRYRNEIRTRSRWGCFFEFRLGSGCSTIFSVHNI